MAQRAELWELSAADAVATMKRGEVTAERYASTLLARCRAAELLNAFITLQPEHVLEAARAADKRRRSNEQLGALHGLPIPVKDSVNTKDMPTTGGTRALRGFQSRVDAPLVARLRDVGAIVFGKTNLHEIWSGYASANLTTGAIYNPYDPTRSPGGELTIILAVFVFRSGSRSCCRQLGYGRSGGRLTNDGPFSQLRSWRASCSSSFAQSQRC